MEEELDLDHPRFRRVQAAIFTRKLVADCMTHRCTMVEHGAEKLDACCQYGCDVDLAERAAILAKADGIRSLLRPEVKDVPWFGEEVERDTDYPSGGCVRTTATGSSTRRSTTTTAGRPRARAARSSNACRRSA